MAERKVKVFGYLGTVRDAAPAPNGNRQVRIIVSASSRAEAARLMGITASDFRNFGSETANADEIAQAMTHPGCPLYFDKNGDGGWHPLRRVRVIGACDASGGPVAGRTPSPAGE